MTSSKHHLTTMASFFRHQLIVVFLTFATFKLADTEIIVSPKDVEAVVGTSAVFNCSSSNASIDIQWNIYPLGKSMQVIYAFGKVGDQYAGRLTVQNGQNLHLESVTVDDAGTYECQDDYGHGEKRSAELTVIVSDPICQSGSNLSKVIRKTICGIKPSQVTLSCYVEYQGNKAPTLEWKKSDDDKAIESGVFSEIRGNQYLHNITLEGDSIVDGSSYTCHLVKATSATTCNSGEITVVAEYPSAAASQHESSKSYVAAIACVAVTLVLALCIMCYLFIKARKEKKTRKQIAYREERRNFLIEGKEEKLKELEKHIEELQAENKQLKAKVTDLESHPFSISLQ